MAFEAIGNFDGAEKLYDAALEEKPTFADAIKRKVRFPGYDLVIHFLI